MTVSNEPVTIFLSYAREDDELLQQLVGHLSTLDHQGLVSIWYDRNVKAGTEWKREIDAHLNRDRIILLLISADFLRALDSMELQRALQRQQNDEAYVIPILLRPCDWQNAPFGHLQALPTDAKPITTWQDRDAAFADVTASIRSLVEALLDGKSSVPPKLRDVIVARREVLQRYFNDLISKHTSLIPAGFAHSASPSLFSVSVPLNDVFIHLKAVPDRPLFPLAIKRSKIEEEIKALRERRDLSAREKEENIQSLRAALWQSELGKESSAAREDANITIEIVLQRLTVQKPVAVILGSPGAGKSITMRWLALHMARVCNQAAQLLEGLAPLQIPVLVRIEDYAKLLSDYNSQPTKLLGQEPTFKKFLDDKLASIEPELPKILAQELREGHCLLLFDGLDEVTTDAVRQRVRDEIYDFIRSCRNRQQDTVAFNRFIVTSRIVGYEPGAFVQFDEYTLDNLNDEQINQFLTSWCLAVERHLAGKNAHEQTMQDELSIEEEGKRQKDKLWQAIQDTPGIKRLAVNPLILTILALMQKVGGKLQHHRINLYESVTQTLLHNWNQTRGGPHFESEEMRVAEEVLRALAYERHSRDLLLTKQRVIEITRAAIARTFQHAVESISEDYLKKFIETLSKSSGLFGERGQGLFDFIHRTFEEYYAAMYLVNHCSTQQLQHFVTQQYHRSTWHEPILLAVAYLSVQKTRNSQNQANDLIKALLDIHNEYDMLLHRNLLLATQCLVDCDYLSIQPAYQQTLANALLDLYGDMFGAGRYTKLQQDIERIMLSWLREQPKECSFLPPLLEALHTALCSPANQQRQEGATHLLASLVFDHLNFPESVLQTLLPPLLQLADVLDIPGIPKDIYNTLPQPAAYPSSPNVADYAFIILRLLGAHGPAGWLHTQWHIWDQADPTLLTRLTEHSLELDYMLTPAAFPSNNDRKELNDNRYQNIYEDWTHIAQKDARSLQVQLMQNSNTARYPHAYLFWQLLNNEQSAVSKGIQWRTTWDRLLQNEMLRGRGATYLTCLNLRLLLWKDNKQQQQAIAQTLLSDLLAPDRRQIYAFDAITNIYLKNLSTCNFELKVVEEALATVIYDIELRYLINLQSLIDLKELRYMTDLEDLGEHPRHLAGSIGLKHFRERAFGYWFTLKYVTYMKNMIDLSYLINIDQLVDSLCHILERRQCDSPQVLFALYSVIVNYDTIPAAIQQQVQQSLSIFVLQAALTLERHLFISAIQHRIGIEAPQSYITPLPHSTPIERAIALDALRQRSQLSSVDAQEILSACTDKRRISGQDINAALEKGAFGLELLNELTRKDNDKVTLRASSVGEIAWGLLFVSWSMEPGAWKSIVDALGKQNALICGAAALLLQRGKNVPQHEKYKAIEYIRAVLADEKLSHRHSDFPSDRGRAFRLSDVLFNTLRVLVA